MPNPTSIELAKLISKLYESKIIVLDQFTQDMELIQLLKEKNIASIANWLNFHSFIKDKLQKVIKSLPVEKLTSEENDHKIAMVVTDYLSETNKKMRLPKFTKADFLIDSDTKYYQLVNKFNSFKINLNLRYKKPLTHDEVKYLLLAKNRRSKILGRYFYGISISSSTQEPKERAFERLTTKILSLTPGSRKQIVYFHDGDDHAMGFDIQTLADGSIKIFCFDSAAHCFQQDTLEKLYIFLQSHQKQFEIKTCRSIMQADTYNCTIYVLAVLNEFGKYKNVFDYLPTNIEEDLFSKNIKESYFEDNLGVKHTFKFENLAKITWVSLKNMPLKVISLLHSYTEMTNVLSSEQLDINPSEFIALHKKKYNFDENYPKRKYIKKRRVNMFNHAEAEIKNVLNEEYETKLQKYPILREKRIENYKEYIAKNKMSLQEIEEVFRFILEKNTINHQVILHERHNLITDDDMEMLLNLRYEYVDELLKLDPEQIVKILNDQPYSNNILQYRLEDSVTNRNRQFPAHLLYVQLLIDKHLDRKKYFYIVRKINAEIHNFPTQTFSNPLGLLPLYKNITVTEVLQKLAAYVDRYKDHTGISLISDYEQIRFFLEVLSSYLPKESEKIFRTAFIQKLSTAHSISLDEKGRYIKTQFELVAVDDKPFYMQLLFQSFDDKQIIAMFFTSIANKQLYYHRNLPTAKEIIEHLLLVKKEKLSMNNILEWVSQCSTLAIKLGFIKSLYDFITQKNNQARIRTYANNVFGQFFYILGDKEPLIDAIIKLLTISNDTTLLSQYEKWIKDIASGNNDGIQYFFKSHRIQVCIEAIKKRNSSSNVNSNNNNNNQVNKNTAVKNITPAQFYTMSTSSDSIYNESWNLTMSSFSTDDFNKNGTKWYQFNTENYKIDNDQDEWKFNLSIHHEDLTKALEIVSHIAKKYGIAIYKVMGLGQAINASQDMRGREMVIYTRYNPEINTSQWIEILSEIENELVNSNIQVSTNTLPKSNRALGRYVSYTHSSWTRYSMDISFQDGIKEQNLEDDDPFKDVSNLHQAKVMQR